MGERSGKWEGASEDTLLLVKHDMSETTTVTAATADDPGKSLKFSQKLAYGVGHVLNDICAAVWFSYTLLYFQVVMGMPQTMTGSLMLVGQIADAFATPVVGVYADRTGRRKLWHLAGTIMTVVSFPLIFFSRPSYEELSGNPINATREVRAVPEGAGGVLGDWIAGMYYAILIGIFQVGWAVVQISHLALIPIMTPSQAERAELTAIRFSWSICSSIFMYLVTWFVLHVTTKTEPGSGKKSSLGPNDGYKFRDLSLIGLVVGGIFSIWFHVILKVPEDVARCSDDAAKAKVDRAAMKRGIIGYLKSILLYQVSILYVSSRLFLTLSLVYMPLYLVEIAGDKAEFLATVPLVSYIASFVASLVIKQLNPFFSSKSIYLIGGILSIMGCIWIGVGIGRLNLSGELFAIAILLGTGSSVTMVSSLCLTADFIGTQTEYGAFVYSVVTFADKLLNGIVVMIIEEFKCKDCPHYYQDVLAYACGASVLIGLFALASMEAYPFSFAKLKETLRNFRISQNN